MLLISETFGNYTFGLGGGGVGLRKNDSWLYDFHFLLYFRLPFATLELTVYCVYLMQNFTEYKILLHRYIA